MYGQYVWTEFPDKQAGKETYLYADNGGSLQANEEGPPTKRGDPLQTDKEASSRQMRFISVGQDGSPSAAGCGIYPGVNL